MPDSLPWDMNSPKGQEGEEDKPRSGFRIPLNSFPTQLAGTPVAYDADGSSPVYLGAAIYGDSVHPCKIVPMRTPWCRVSKAGKEHKYAGQCELLPFEASRMEWVPTSGGNIPAGRRPIEGGHEGNGQKLYHAMGIVHGIRVPGKAGIHLNGARLPYGGKEHRVRDYDLLCWK